MAINLFNPNYYRLANPDLANFNDAQAFNHFITFGLNEGRQFSPLVNLNFYRANNPDLATAGLTTNQQLLDHLQNFGINEGRKFSPLVDLNYYRSHNSDLVSNGLINNSQLFTHLQNLGLDEGRVFSPFYDTNYYRNLNPDLSAAGLSNRQLFEHFVNNGIIEGRYASPLVLFDAKYYLSNNPSLAATGLTTNSQLWQHFQNVGYTAGLKSSAFFDRLPIESLSESSRWMVPFGGSLTFSFVTSATASTYQGPETGIREVSEPIKNNIRNILHNLYASFLPFGFTEVPETATSQGQIRFMFSNGDGLPNFYAYAITPDTNSINISSSIHLNPNYVNNNKNGDFEGNPGSYGYQSLIHEIGHALGLKHPGNYNGDDVNTNVTQPPFLPFEQDNKTNTIMSYNQPDDAPLPMTPMADDIRTLQFLYGAKYPSQATATYYFDNAILAQKKTLFTTANNNTLDCSAVTDNGSYYVLDMNEGKKLISGSSQLKSTYKARGDTSLTSYLADRDGTVIAYGSKIDNLIGSQGNDLIIGTPNNNIIIGGAGADFLIGGGGVDTLTGGAGADTFQITAGQVGYSVITDFTPGEDKINLAGGLKLADLIITQGIGGQSNSTLIQAGSTGQLLAQLVNIPVTTAIAPLNFSIG